MDANGHIFTLVVFLSQVLLVFLTICTALFYFSVSCFVTVMAVSVTTLVLLLLINLDVGLDITAIKHDLEEAEAAE